jgi:peptidoglycan hydrolase CwlO-like protein
MTADSDSSIAWHRAQIKKHRETLKLLESGEVTLGEIAGSSRKIDQTQRTIANLKREIGQSEQIISAYERRNAKRPRATDRESLARVRWT